MTENERKFREFHRNNPHICRKFYELANKARAVGFKHYGAQGVIEQILWWENVTIRGRDDVKISNNHAAFYSASWSREGWSNVARSSPFWPV